MRIEGASGLGEAQIADRAIGPCPSASDLPDHGPDLNRVGQMAFVVQGSRRVEHEDFDIRQGLGPDLSRPIADAIGARR